MMKKEPIVFLFNSPLASGCDYVVQTMRIVSRTHPVYGLALGDIISLPQLLRFQNILIVRHVHGAVVVRPVSIFPGLRFRFVRMFSYIVFAIALRIYVDFRHRSHNKFLWFFEPFHIPPLLSVFFGYRTVYDCVDFYPSFHRSARSEHDQLMRKSTHVFTNSNILARMFRNSRPDIITVPLGFAHELFGSMRVSPVRPKKRAFTVGYIGSISDRIDFKLLNNIISSLPDIKFVFVGPLEKDVYDMEGTVEKDFQLLRSYKNVNWTSGVPKSEIPGIVQSFDIGLIPYRVDNAFNKNSFPMKTMEYFALGRLVISTDIIALRGYAHAGLLSIISTPDDFVQCVRRYSRRGWSASSQNMQRKEAANNSWISKVSAIQRVLYSAR